jgi:hypothetical protein
MTSLEKNEPFGNVAEALTGQVKRLIKDIEGMAKQGQAAHEVERTLWQSVLALGRELMQVFFDSLGDGDEGPVVVLKEGRTVRRLEAPHRRVYQSVFGSFVLERVVYGTREDQKIEFVPLDARLQLPEDKWSYLLQEWDQGLAVEMPYAQVNATLERILGFSQPVDSLERMNRTMASGVAEFWDAQPPPPAREEGERVVATADGKGVPIRRPAAEAAIEGHRPKKGPKPNRKKIATLGAVYTIERYRRTPEQIVEALFQDPQDKPAEKGKRPEPQHKRVRASLARSPDGRTEPAIEAVFGWMGAEIRARDPDTHLPLPCLMDGQGSLWEAAHTYLPQENLVPILDWLHVTPRLWKAAYLFYPERSQAAVDFVKDRVLRLLKGEVRSVIRGLRRRGTTAGLRGKKREKLDKICSYFEANEDRMRYHEYRAEGYPIATGVIEGACRHLVKDRMERAGMRWSLEGAQAMLDLRSLHISGQWDEFTAHRIRKETERLYPQARSHPRPPLPLAA